MQNKFTLTRKRDVVNLYLEVKRLDIVRSEFKTSIYIIKNILKEAGVEIARRKQPLNIKYFKNIDTPEKAYWLGFIAADGCLHKTKYKLSLCVKDADILFKFQKAIGAGSPVRHRIILDKRTGKTNQQYNLQINSKEFCQYICSHGVDENKSKQFSFPKIEEKYYSHFIRGLYDGDGSIHVNKSKIKKKINYRINMISSIECITFIKMYFEDKLKFKVPKIYSKYDQGIHYLNMEQDALKFLEWIYKDSREEIRLDRKYEKYISNLQAFEDQKRLIVNEKTGESFSIRNVRQFCSEKGLNENVIHRTLKTGKSSKNGKHAGWKLVY